MERPQNLLADVEQQHHNRAKRRQQEQIQHQKRMHILPGHPVREP